MGAIMAYKRTHRVDIRTAQLTVQPKLDTSDSERVTIKSTAIEASSLPTQDIRKIALISIPLLALLVVAHYYDGRTDWVIHFASWLFTIGK